MRKKSLLALLLTAMLLLSGCALVTVDEEVDNARVIIDVNGETVNKQAVNDYVDYQLNQNAYMNQLYSALGMNLGLSTDRATIQNQVVDGYINSLVAKQKAAALGFDQMTDEDNAAIEEAAQESYHEYLHQVASAYIDTTDLDEEAQEAKAEEYIKDHNLSGKDVFVKSAADEKAVEKLRADTVKDVAVTEEELNAALTEKAEANKTTYDTTPDQYGYAVNNGTAVYYAPAGYRFVKQILVKFTEEDSAAISEKTTAQTTAQTALTDAQKALDEAAEDADKDALQAAVDEAQKALDEAAAALKAAEETARQNIQEKTDEIYAKATAEGADFDALVAEYNEDTGMPAAGYALREGYGYFVSSFTEAAMALSNVGDVSQPVQSNYGYHIIQYTADIPEGTVALDTVRETLEAELLSTKQDEAYTTALAAWVEEAQVKTYLDRLN